MTDSVDQSDYNDESDCNDYNDECQYEKKRLVF